MAQTDRTFRALARASPHTVLSLLRLVAPGLLPEDDARIVALDDPQLDVPPHPRQADFVATTGDDGLTHVEAQGYRDRDFLRRLFDYHLLLALRHPERTVRSCALWLRPPPSDQRVQSIVRGNVTVRVETVVLAEVPAALLLSRPETACFALGADAGATAVDVLCDDVVRALGRPDARAFEQAMAAVAALTTGRYPQLVKAMERADMEPILLEDLIDYGYEQGLAAGHEAGREEGRQAGREEGRRAGQHTGRLAEARAAVLVVLGARGLADARATERVEACDDVAQLERWLRHAAVATSLDEVFG